MGGISPSGRQAIALIFFAFILFTDRFIRNLLLIIVLPVILAVLFVVAACVKVRPTRKSRSEKYGVYNVIKPVQSYRCLSVLRVVATDITFQHSLTFPR